MNIKIIKKNKNTVVMLVLLLSALFLRIWKIHQSMRFITDFGWFYIEAKNLLEGGYWPLVGGPSSVPVLKQGGAWTYLLAMSLKLGKMNPFFGVYLSIFLGLLSLAILYYLVLAHWNRRIALYSLFIASFFPTIVMNDRLAYHPAGIFPFSLLFAYFALKKPANIKNFFFSGLFWGVLFQFELAAGNILLIYFIYLLTLSKKEFSVKHLIAFLAGCFWGSFPYFIYDLRNGVFIQTVGFVIWMVEKILEKSAILIPLGFILLIFRKRLYGALRSVSDENRFIFIWLFLGVLSFLVRGAVSESYLPLIFFPLSLSLGLLIDHIMKKSKSLGLVVSGLFLFVCLYTVNSKVHANINSEFTLYHLQEVANYITRNEERKSIDLIYNGPGAQFGPGLSSLEYLLYLNGITVDRNSNIKYEIIYPGYTMLPKYNEVAKVGGIVIAKT